MSVIPGYDDDHPLNDWLKRVAPVALVVLAALVWFMQYTLREFAEQRLDAPIAERARSQEITEPGIAALTIRSKLAVRSARLDEEIDAADAADDLKELDGIAESRVDRVRVATVAGELLGPKEAIKRLEALAKEVEEGSDLASDVQWLIKLYQPEGRAEVPEEATKALMGRHGWFASLAVSHGLPASDAFRKSVVGGGERVGLVFVGYALATVITGVVSIVLLVMVVVAIRRGDWQSELEVSGLPGSAYLEMFVIFLLTFLVCVGTQIFTLWLTGPASVAGLALTELLTWLLPVCFVWPWLRGMDFEDVRTDLGWTLGAGLVTELKAGVIGYLATIPVVSVVGWVAHFVESQVEQEHSGGRYVPFEAPLSGSWLPVVLGTLSAVVWAPIVEETLFRGALYRAVRGRFGAVAAILTSALFFGAIHPYSAAGLITVGTSGVMFGLLREWRGSLIAPITAHFLHNATISAMEILLIAAVD